jgi:hypothetical protein
LPILDAQHLFTAGWIHYVFIKAAQHHWVQLPKQGFPSSVDPNNQRLNTSADQVEDEVLLNSPVSLLPFLTVKSYSFTLVFDYPSSSLVDPKFSVLSYGTLICHQVVPVDIPSKLSLNIPSTWWLNW